MTNRKYSNSRGLPTGKDKTYGGPKITDATTTQDKICYKGDTTTPKTITKLATNAVENTTKCSAEGGTPCKTSNTFLEVKQLFSYKQITKVVNTPEDNKQDKPEFSGFLYSEKSETATDNLVKWYRKRKVYFNKLELRRKAKELEKEKVKERHVTWRLQNMSEEDKLFAERLGRYKEEKEASDLTELNAEIYNSQVDASGNPPVMIYIGNENNEPLVLLDEYLLNGPTVQPKNTGLLGHVVRPLQPDEDAVGPKKYTYCHYQHTLEPSETYRLVDIDMWLGGIQPETKVTLPETDIMPLKDIEELMLMTRVGPMNRLSPEDEEKRICKESFLIKYQNWFIPYRSRVSISVHTVVLWRACINLRQSIWPQGTISTELDNPLITEKVSKLRVAHIRSWLGKPAKNENYGRILNRNQVWDPDYIIVWRRALITKLAGDRLALQDISLVMRRLEELMAVKAGLYTFDEKEQKVHILDELPHQTQSLREWRESLGLNPNYDDTSEDSDSGDDNMGSDVVRVKRRFLTKKNKAVAINEPSTLRYWIRRRFDTTVLVLSKNKIKSRLEVRKTPSVWAHGRSVCGGTGIDAVTVTKRTSKRTLNRLARTRGLKGFVTPQRVKICALKRNEMRALRNIREQGSLVEVPQGNPDVSGFIVRNTSVENHFVDDGQEELHEEYERESRELWKSNLSDADKINRGLRKLLRLLLVQTMEQPFHEILEDVGTVKLNSLLGSLVYGLTDTASIVYYEPLDDWSLQEIIKKESDGILETPTDVVHLYLLERLLIETPADSLEQTLLQMFDGFIKKNWLKKKLIGESSLYAPQTTVEHLDVVEEQPTVDDKSDADMRTPPVPDNFCIKTDRAEERHTLAKWDAILYQNKTAVEEFVEDMTSEELTEEFIPQKEKFPRHKVTIIPPTPPKIPDFSRGLLVVEPTTPEKFFKWAALQVRYELIPILDIPPEERTYWERAELLYIEELRQYKIKGRALLEASREQRESDEKWAAEVYKEERSFFSKGPGLLPDWNEYECERSCLIRIENEIRFRGGKQLASCGEGNSGLGTANVCNLFCGNNDTLAYYTEPELQLPQPVCYKISKRDRFCKYNKGWSELEDNLILEGILDSNIVTLENRIAWERRSGHVLTEKDIERSTLDEQYNWDAYTLKVTPRQETEPPKHDDTGVTDTVENNKYIPWPKSLFEMDERCPDYEEGNHSAFSKNLRDRFVYSTTGLGKRIVAHPAGLEEVYGTELCTVLASTNLNEIKVLGADDRQTAVTDLIKYHINRALTERNATSTHFWSTIRKRDTFFEKTNVSPKCRRALNQPGGIRTQQHYLLDYSNCYDEPAAEQKEVLMLLTWNKTNFAVVKKLLPDLTMEAWAQYYKSYNTVALVLRFTECFIKNKPRLPKQRLAKTQRKNVYHGYNDGEKARQWRNRMEIERAEEESAVRGWDAKVLVNIAVTYEDETVNLRGLQTVDDMRTDAEVSGEKVKFDKLCTKLLSSIKYPRIDVIGMFDRLDYEEVDTEAREILYGGLRAYNKKRKAELMSIQKHLEIAKFGEAYVEEEVIGTGLQNPQVLYNEEEQILDTPIQDSQLTAMRKANATLSGLWEGVIKTSKKVYWPKASLRLENLQIVGTNAELSDEMFKHTVWNTKTVRDLINIPSEKKRGSESMRKKFYRVSHVIEMPDINPN